MKGRSDGRPPARPFPEGSARARRAACTGKQADCRVSITQVIRCLLYNKRHAYMAENTANRPAFGSQALLRGALYGIKSWVVWAIEDDHVSPLLERGRGSALVIASRNGHLQIVKYLLELPLDKYSPGGDGDPEVYVSDDAREAWFQAVNNKHYRVVQYLMNLPANVPVHSENIVNPAWEHNQTLFDAIRPRDYRHTVDVRMIEIFLRDRRVMGQLEDDVRNNGSSDPFFSVCAGNGLRDGDSVDTLERMYNAIRTERARKAIAMGQVMEGTGMPDAAADVLRGMFGDKCPDCAGIVVRVREKRKLPGNFQ
jgi:hypothetical protein